jgi:hypothetical protein
LGRQQSKNPQSVYFVPVAALVLVMVAGAVAGGGVGFIINQFHIIQESEGRKESI